MLVFAPDSSIKTSLAGSKPSCRRRHALRAMRTLGNFERRALQVQKAERRAKVEESQGYALKDYVTPVVELGRDRMLAEAKRRGLEYAAELDMETIDAIALQAEADLKAQGIDCGPEPRASRRHAG